MASNRTSFTLELNTILKQIIKNWCWGDTNPVKFQTLTNREEYSRENPMNWPMWEHWVNFGIFFPSWNIVSSTSTIQPHRYEYVKSLWSTVLLVSYCDWVSPEVLFWSQLCNQAVCLTTNSHIPNHQCLAQTNGEQHEPWQFWLCRWLFGLHLHLQLW